MKSFKQNFFFLKHIFMLKIILSLFIFFYFIKVRNGKRTNSKTHLFISSFGILVTFCKSFFFVKFERTQKSLVVFSDIEKFLTLIKNASLHRAVFGFMDFEFQIPLFPFYLAILVYCCLRMMTLTMFLKVNGMMKRLSSILVRAS